MLDELAALGLGLCRNLQERALAAEDAGEAAMLANAFHRVSRSVRQTLALDAKLARDAKRDVADDRIEARAETRRAVDHRRKQLATSVERLIWTEREQEDAEDLADQLESLLDAEELEDGFTTQPIDHLITRICEDLGISPPPCGEGAGGGGVSAEFGKLIANPSTSSATHSLHPHPNPSPQGGGARPSG